SATPPCRGHHRTAGRHADDLPRRQPGGRPDGRGLNRARPSRASGRYGVDLDAEQSRPVDPAVRGKTTTGTPWLLVVARGHARLVAELQAIFRECPWVQVIENRRQGEALLSRNQSFLRPG